MAENRTARATARALWLVGGLCFGGTIGVGLFRHSEAPLLASLWDAAPWLSAAWLVFWTGSLAPSMMGRPRAPLGAVALALALALAGVGAAMLVADWWMADTRVNPRPDRGPILLLWSLCGALGGLSAGFGSGWVRLHGKPRGERLSAACRVALMWMVLFGVLGLVFLPLSYFLMSAPYRVPLPAIHHPAIGWLISGAACGLLGGGVSNQIARFASRGSSHPFSDAV